MTQHDCEKCKKQEQILESIIRDMQEICALSVDGDFADEDKLDMIRSVAKRVVVKIKQTQQS